MKTFISVIVFLIAPVSPGLFLQSGEKVTISQPVYEDVYLAGGTVVINAPIHGDLIVTGGTITINDSVYQDLITVGGTVTVNGYVGDDIRCAGGSISLSKNTAGDVVVMGGEITLDENTTVFGNALISGGVAKLNGTVKGEVKAQTGEFELNGQVENNLDCRAGKININGIVTGKSVLAANSITLGTRAAFEDDVRYWNKHESLEFGESIKKGKATFDPELKIQSGHWALLGFASVLMLIWYLGTALLMIFLIQWLFGPTLKRAAEKALQESLKSIGFGAVFWIGIPIAIIITFISLIGVPVGLILLLTYIIFIILATCITAIVAAHWINNVYYASSWSTAKLVGIGFLIFIVLKMASLTPVVGPLIMLLLACLAFGSLLLTVRWKRNIIQPT